MTDELKEAIEAEIPSTRFLERDGSPFAGAYCYVEEVRRFAEHHATLVKAHEADQKRIEELEKDLEEECKHSGRLREHNTLMFHELNRRKERITELEAELSKRDSLLRRQHEALVDLAQKRGWLLGDNESVSVALDNADAVVAAYQENMPNADGQPGAELGKEAGHD